ADSKDQEARSLFAAANAKIRNLNHLVEVTETRSRILVNITAGICSRYSPGFENAWERHLDAAIAQLTRLPKRGAAVCTVFSPFSKRNEDPATIEAHVSAFREENMLLNI